MVAAAARAAAVRERAHVLTSRNSAAPAAAGDRRRATRTCLKSNGGGGNAILVRGVPIARAPRRHGCARRPERRWVHGVRLADGSGSSTCTRTTAPEAAARADCERAASAAREWAGAPLVLGGDLNLRAPELRGAAPRRAATTSTTSSPPGRTAAGPAEVLERGPLSDHAPLAVTLA